MQARGASLASGILYDSDMGRNIDAALALAMLHGLGRGRLIAIGISNSNLEAAAFCDAVARFYIGDAGARNTGIGGVLPIGLAENGPKLEDVSMLPAFPHGIRNIIDTADPPIVFRNALLTQQDKQGIAVLAGPATNFAHTLVLNKARDIVAAKVRLLVMAAGDFSNGGADSRMRADIPSARKLLSEWPSPIVAVGAEAGNAASFPNSSLDPASLPSHPALAAYRIWRETHTNTNAISSQAMLGVLYASNPNAEYFKLSPPGVIEVSDDGRTRFRESASGNHRYLIIEPGQKDAIVQAISALVVARPATGRGAPKD